MEFIDLRPSTERLRSEIERRIFRVLSHQKFILGPEVEELEEQLRRRAQVAHCVTCASGTDALVLSLRALGVGPGDAVLVPAFTFSATASAVKLTGATPWFVDVEPDTALLSPRTLKAAVDAHQNASASTLLRAVIPVDLYGSPCDYDEINAFAKQHHLGVIADAAQSFGALTPTGPVGRLAHLTATSFFPTKPLGAFGDGGAVFTDNSAQAELLLSLRSHGKGKDKYHNDRVGLNSRLDTVQAAVLLAKLTIFDEELEQRQELSERYRELLSGVSGLTLVTPRPDDHSAWAQFTVRVKQRDAVKTALEQAGIPTMVYYPVPLHQQPAFAPSSTQPHSLLTSETLAREVLSLPFYPSLPLSAVEKVCSTLKRAVLEHTREPHKFGRANRDPLD